MDPEQRTDRTMSELDADARATRLLIWLGIGALALLAIWIVVVLVAFM